MSMKHPIIGFEHLHLHSDFSLLDGYGMVEEYAKRAREINQQYLCVSDHGAMGVIPRQIRACEKNKINPIFACELYVNPHQPGDQKLQDYIKDWSDVDKKKARKSYHLLAIATNEVGYKNLVKLSSWGWLHGFYRFPRVNHEQLMKYKEGIIFTSCCYNSEIGQAFDRGGEEAAEEMLVKYMDMFSPNFYLEIMLLDFEKQKPYDAFILKMKEKYGLPIILTNDCHYCKKEDSEMQQKMLMVQTNITIQDIQRMLKESDDADLFVMQDKNLYMKSEEELDQKWESDYSHIIDYELYKEAKATTVEVCRKAQGVELDRSIKLPEYDNQDGRLRDAIEAGFKKRQLPNTKEYRSRIEEEYELICEKGFASYFLIQQMICDEARRWYMETFGGTGSEAVGPGRGSGVGALTNYCLGITDVDPLKHDLLFSRFLSPARGGKQMDLEFTIDPIGVEELACESP